MGSKCFVFWAPKGTTLCETTSFDVLLVKIDAQGLLEKRKNASPKKFLAESLSTRWGEAAGAASENPLSYRDKILQRVGVVPDLSPRPNLVAIGLGDEDSGGQISPFSIELHLLTLSSLKQLVLPCQCVICICKSQLRIFKTHVKLHARTYNV